MGAHVLDRVVLALAEEHGDRRVAVPDHAEFALAELVLVADPDPTVHLASSSRCITRRLHDLPARRPPPYRKGFASTSKARSSRVGKRRRGSPEGNGRRTPARRQPRRWYQPISGPRRTVTVLCRS